MRAIDQRQAAVLKAALEVKRSRSEWARQQRRASDRASRWLTPLIVLGGFFVGWRSARGRIASAQVCPPHDTAASAGRPATRREASPSWVGWASLMTASWKAAPVVLPLALAWLDRKNVAETSSGPPHARVPFWLLGLRLVDRMSRRS